MIRDILEQSIRAAFDALSLEADEIHLEHPAELSHGDYATNVAFVLAQKAGKKPHDIAHAIAAHIEERRPKEVERVEVAGAGFVNFFLSRDFFTYSVAEILRQQGAWGSNNTHKGEKVMVEYTDPNPFKEFHIGHLMSNAIGESIARLVEFSGAEVKRANYQGDVGLHVAKAIWGKRHNPELSWGEAYVEGANAYDMHKKEIDTLNKVIYEKSDPEVTALYDAGREASLDAFEKIYTTLGTTFDDYFFESETGPVGLDVVANNKDVFEESDGAIIYRGEKAGLHTRVFVNSEGLPTYEAKELGLFKSKISRWDPDRLVVVTGNEITEYFKVVCAAASEIAELKDIAEMTTHIPHGMLRLPSGKMSSRTGDVITAESLITNVQGRTSHIMEGRDIKDKESVSLLVAVGALKYSILRQATGKDIVFNEEQALSFEGDSGPYLQYAHTRAASVLRKAAERDCKPDTTHVDGWGTTDLERLLYRFAEVVERAQEEYEPHHVTTYLVELASAFNHWYAHERILGAGDETPYRLALTQACAATLHNGLWLLGISALDHM